MPLPLLHGVVVASRCCCHCYCFTMLLLLWRRCCCVPCSSQVHSHLLGCIAFFYWLACTQQCPLQLEQCFSQQWFKELTWGGHFELFWIWCIWVRLSLEEAKISFLLLHQRMCVSRFLDPSNELHWKFLSSTIVAACDYAFSITAFGNCLSFSCRYVICYSWIFLYHRFIGFMSFESFCDHCVIGYSLMKLTSIADGYNWCFLLVQSTFQTAFSLFSVMVWCQSMLSFLPCFMAKLALFIYLL